MADSESPATPAWVTSGLNVESYDEEARNLVGVATGPVTFGTIDDGWTVEVSNAGRNNTPSIDAQQVGAKVQLVLESPAGGGLEIGNQFRTVEVRNARVSPVRLAPQRNRTKLVLAPGTYLVTSDVTIRMHANAHGTHQRKHNIDVGGDGTVCEIAGQGYLNLRIQCTPGSSMNGLVGAVVFHDRVEGLEGTSPEAVVTFEQPTGDVDITAARVIARDTLHGSEIRAGHVRVERPVTDSALTVSAQLEAVHGVTGCTITVSANGDDHEGRPEPAVSIGALFGGDAAPLQVDVEDDSIPRTAWSPRSARQDGLINSIVYCPSGRHIAVTSMVDSTIATDGHVWVHGDARWDSAPADTPGIQSASLRLQGDLLGTDRTPIHVSGALFVVGKARNVAIDARTAAVSLNSEVVHADVAAEDLRIVSGGQGVTVDVCCRAVVHADVTGPLRLSGNADIDGAIAKTVTYTPRDEETKLNVGGSVAELVATGTEHTAEIHVGPDASLSSLTAGGRTDISFEAPSRNNSRQPPPGLAELHLRERSVLVLRSQAGIDVSQLTHDNDARIALVGGGAEKPFVLPVTEVEELHLATSGTVALDVHDGGRPCMELSGWGQFKIRGELGDVTCQLVAPDWLPGDRSDDGSGPVLSTTSTGAVFGLSGAFRLTGHYGRITGTPGPRTSRRWIEHLRSWATGRPEWEPGNAPARLLAIDLSEGRKGQLHRVDPTELPYDQTTHLKRLHTFEPDGPALIGDALTDPGGQFDRQEHAEKTRTMAGIVAERSVSGSARTAAMWASARAHHRQVRATSRVEWVSRFLHRAVGYSQRPLPAFISWLTMILGWWILLLNADHAGSCASLTENAPVTDLTALEQLLRVLLAPASFFRLPGELTDIPVLCEVGWQALLVVCVALPAIYFFIAVRNVLANPTDRV